MDTLKPVNDVCKLSSKCAVAGTSLCNVLCNPFILLHGTSGLGGFWSGRNVPKKYDDCFFHNLPIAEENPIPYQWARFYLDDIIGRVESGMGFFFYSVPTEDNNFGTGTGKTTTAVTLLNEYVLARVIEHVKGGKKIEKQPALFYKASDFQNVYNAQFRGTAERQEAASMKYYAVKELMMTVDLLVFDDIGIRQKITDAFENELTEIIDAREAECLATIYTSNLPLYKLVDTLGYRIVSRIEGSTEQIAFKGKDHRKGGILK